jgi:hypothetical protein
VGLGLIQYIFIGFVKIVYPILTLLNWQINNVYRIIIIIISLSWKKICVYCN